MKKVLISILILFFLTNSIIFLLGKSFIYKALVYNYVNIDDHNLFPMRPITPSNEPFNWPKSHVYNNQSLSAFSDSIIKLTRTVSFLVIKDDSLCFEQYWEGYSDQVTSNSFSMAKSITSAAIGAAIQDGFIKSVDQPIGDFLPEFRSDGKEKITIKHLLQMSSGLSWDEAYSSPFSLTTEAYYGKNLKKLIDNLFVESPPGIKYNYLSGDTQILGFVVEKATGKKLATFIEEKIWQPIGAETKGGWSLDKKDGMEKAFCCVYSTAKDFAKFGKLYLDSGRVKGVQVIPESYVLESTTGSMLPDEFEKPTDYYGYQWWIIPDFQGRKIFYARGILGQYVFVCPEERLIAVRLGHIRHDSRTNNVPTEIYWYLSEAFRIANID